MFYKMEKETKITKVAKNIGNGLIYSAIPLALGISVIGGNVNTTLTQYGRIANDGCTANLNNSMRTEVYDFDCDGQLDESQTLIFKRGGMIITRSKPSPLERELFSKALTELKTSGNYRHRS